jgi:hypothetical protein
MPLKRCNDGKGWQYGDSGKCYESKRDAIKQGVAIDGPEKFKQEMSKSSASLSSSDIAFTQSLLRTPAKADRDAFLKSVASTIESMDISLAYIPEHERDKIPDEDFAGKHRSFPIRSATDAEHAAHLIGHAPNPSEVKRNIIAICKRKGIPIPEAWR